MKKIFLGLIIIGLGALFSGFVLYQKYSAPTLAPQVADWKNYTNNEYGFKLIFPESWKGYSVMKKTWTGQKLEESGTVSGVLLVFRNSHWTKQEHWQDIPIMIFTPEVWQLVEQEKIAVSAAPIGPQKIGENKKYIFATPPRWYGFTDDKNWQEVVEIVKTFTSL